MLLDRGLPRQELFDRQQITAACFFKGQQNTAHRRNHLSLAPDDPTLSAGRRQIGNRQRAAVRPEHVFGAVVERGMSWKLSTHMTEQLGKKLRAFG